MSHNSLQICWVATVPYSIVHHLKGQFKAAIDRGDEVTIISSPGRELEDLANEFRITIYPIRINRTVSPWADIRSLISLFYYFRKKKFDIIHSITPKAGLLCAIAGLLARVQIRLHTFTGQPWETLSGFMRQFSRLSDWIIVRLNTRCYADSPSQASYLVTQRIARAGEIDVLGNGCLGGVNLSRFNPAIWENWNEVTKEEIGIPTDGQVIIYVGRITKDKGITELAGAFNKLLQQDVNAYLVLVGPVEPERDPLPSVTIQYLQHNQRIKLVGYTAKPERFLAISDVFCIPSYREGFGTVVIEAAAMGVPTVGTKIVGLIDSIIDGETGILVPSGDIEALYDALLLLLTDENRRKAMGIKAQQRAAKLFDERIVSHHVMNEYDKLVTSLKK